MCYSMPITQIKCGTCVDKAKAILGASPCKMSFVHKLEHKKVVRGEKRTGLFW
jgi:hypothetical protein